MIEIINGYQLLEPLHNHDAGFSRWTFASKGGVTYYLKEFLDPVYPDEDSLSVTLRNNRIQECIQYEKHKKELYAAVNTSSDGNLVRILEFFRCDSHYYIVTPKINESDITLEEIASQTMFTRLMLCATVAHSMMKLHECGVVHADIKDSNVLVHRSKTGQMVGKIIDFDCSFFQSNCPEDEDDLGGDQVYMAPESCQFICGEDVQLTSKIDVFALGLLFHQYLTGALPIFNQDKYDYPYEAVLDDQELVLFDLIPSEIQSILRQMLLCSHRERCSSGQVYQNLITYIRSNYPVKGAEKTGNEEKAQDTASRFFYSAGDL